MKKLISTLVIWSLFFPFVLTAKTTTKNSLSINQLALPSEVKNIGKKSGSIYYSPSIKNKILVPVHFWGAVKNSGLHFIPIDTSVINGISLAGGPSTDADLSDVRLTRNVDGKLKTEYFDLEDGGNAFSFNYKISPGDTVYLSKDHFYQNRAYYTSLIGIIATIVSTIVISRQL